LEFEFGENNKLEFLADGGGTAEFEAGCGYAVETVV
jgi:hypothetical protein